MKDTTVAARYARALFIVTEKRKETVRALEDLRGMWEVLQPGSVVGRFLATPQVKLADKRRVLVEKLEGRCLRSVTLFVDLLLRKKRMPELSTILVEFEALVERSQGIRRAHVVSAVSLTRKETERLQRELERMTKGQIRLTSEVDGSLLGGALVRMGDRVVDRSVKSLLETIEHQLAEVSV
jgi:F-type H+-transporting ATPase subunit delta